MVIDCFKEDNPLIQKKLKEVTVEEGLEIATKLFQILNEKKDGIGSGKRRRDNYTDGGSSTKWYSRYLSAQTDF